MKTKLIVFKTFLIVFLIQFTSVKVEAQELSGSGYSAKTKKNCRYGRYTIGRAKGRCRSFKNWCKLRGNRNKKSCNRKAKTNKKKSVKRLNNSQRSCQKYGRYKSSGNCRTLAGWCKLRKNKNKSACRGSFSGSSSSAKGKNIKTKGGVFPLKKCYGLKNDGGAGHYGARRRGVNGAHTGVDWYAPKGSAVRSPWSGRVISSSYNSITGNIVVIQHDDGRVTRALHLNAKSVKAGQRIRAGQNIGTVGNTGNARHQHSHLHFEVRKGPYRPCSKKEVRRKQCGLTRRYGRAQNPSRIFPGCQWDSKR